MRCRDRPQSDRPPDEAHRGCLEDTEVKVVDGIGIISGRAGQ